MEARIATTTQSLQAIKGVKMTGVTGAIRNDLTDLRRAEARKLRRFRYVLLVVAWAAWIPVIMAPILGFTLYAVVVGKGNLNSIGTRVYHFYRQILIKVAVDGAVVENSKMK